jgi:hypothetical protein
MTYDSVNCPAHYAEGRKFEVIEVIEDWAQFAPNVKQGIALGAALKYLGRLYTKDDGITSTPELNLRKAQWYLDRLMGHMMDDGPIPFDPGDLDLGDSMPWDKDDPYDHPDTRRFGLKNMGALANDSRLRHLGLVGGISDGDLTDEDWAAIYDMEFHVDVDDPEADGSVSIDIRL